MDIVVLGNGAWGSALATHFATLNHTVTVWSRSRTSPPPGCKSVDGDQLPYADVIVLATPAQTTREILQKFGNQIPVGTRCVITAKGIELGSLALQSDVVLGVRDDLQPFVLTGPSFAADVSAGKPTALTLAGTDIQSCNDLRDALSGNGIRIYSSGDLIGAQIGGALKNVIAIACGIVAGSDFGSSAQAALMTRGFAELARLGQEMGGQLETLSGLSGLGDLTLTCHSETSRNFSYGLTLARTQKAPNSGTFEGAKSAAAALELGRKFGVDMPITHAVAQVVAQPDRLETIIDALLNRPLRKEIAN